MFTLFIFYHMTWLACTVFPSRSRLKLTDQLLHLICEGSKRTFSPLPCRTPLPPQPNFYTTPQHIPYTTLNSQYTRTPLPSPPLLKGLLFKGTYVPGYGIQVYFMIT